jgi:hypothetical protein
MLPRLDSGEIERMSRFGEVRCYVEGEILAGVLRGTKPADIPVEQPTKLCGPPISQGDPEHREVRRAAAFLAAPARGGCA